MERDYWTFYQIKQDEMLAEFDEDARKRVQKRRKKRELSNKEMFIHDLWADYAHSVYSSNIRLPNSSSANAAAPAAQAYSFCAQGKT